MTIKIATFNVENLFERALAMNNATWKEGQPAIDAVTRLNKLFGKATYSDRDKNEMLELLGEFGQLEARPRDRFVSLVKIRGQLVSRRGGTPQIVAEGRENFSAPEQLDGVEAHPSADIYALGRVFSFILTGRYGSVGLKEPWSSLVKSLTAPEPEERPSITTVLRRLPR